jgi:hypothetical protein
MFKNVSVLQLEKYCNYKFKYQGEEMVTFEIFTFIIGMHIGDGLKMNISNYRTKNFADVLKKHLFLKRNT